MGTIGLWLAFSVCAMRAALVTWQMLRNPNGEDMTGQVARLTAVVLLLWAAAAIWQVIP